MAKKRLNDAEVGSLIRSLSMC